MKQWILILGLLLVVQGGLALYLTQSDSAADFMEAGAKWLELDPSSIDRIRLSGRPADASDETLELTLVQTDGAWQIEGSPAIPADSQKVESILQDLSQIEASWPIATTTESATRFEVGAEDYQRRIQLMAGDQVQEEIYLGTSPGLRKVHARRGEDELTLAIDFAVHRVPLKSQDWIRRSTLQLDPESIQAVKTEGWTLSRDGDEWRLDRSVADRALDQSAAEKWIETLANLMPDDIQGDAPAGSVDISQWQLTLETGEREMQWFRDEADDLWLKLPETSLYYRLSSGPADNLIQVDLETLLQAQPDTGDDSEALQPEVPEAAEGEEAAG